MIETDAGGKTIGRELVKYETMGDDLLETFTLACSAADMRHLFNVGNDRGMCMCYLVETPEQKEFFRSQGIEITEDGDWFVEAYSE